MSNLKSNNEKVITLARNFSRRACKVSGVDGWIILKWIFRNWDVGVWTESNWLRIGTGGGHL